MSVDFDPENGVTAKKAFHSFDTMGKSLPTNEPELLESILKCKKSINLHIKMWIEGYDDMMEDVEYYMKLFNGEPPSWVEDSFRKQLSRRQRHSQ